MARALGVPRVVVNRHSGILSAFGIALADNVREAQRSVARVYAQDDAESFDAVFDEMSTSLVQSLKDAGADNDSIVVQRYLELRYKGTL